MTHIFICKTKGKLLKSSNESKDIKWIILEDLKKQIEENEMKFYPMHINTLKKYLELNYKK